MAERVQLIFAENPGDLPAAYQLPPGLDLVLSSVVARFNGAAAAATFIPVLEVLSQDDKLMARVRPDQEFAVGDTGVVTFAPFLRRQAAAAAGGSAPTYAYIVKTTNQTITTGTNTKLTSYDTSFTNDATSFSLSLADGDIFILQQGIYQLWYHVVWTATFANIARAFVNSGTFFIGFANFWVGPTVAERTPSNHGLLGGSALGICDDPGANPSVNSDNSISVFQTSGVNQTIDRAHFAITRYGDFS